MASTEPAPSLHSLLGNWLASHEREYVLYIDGMTCLFRLDGDVIHLSVDIEDDIPGQKYDEGLMLQMVWPSMASFPAALAWRKQSKFYCLIDTFSSDTAISRMIRRLEAILNQAETWHSMLASAPAKAPVAVQSRSVSQVHSLGSSLLMESLQRQAAG